MVRTTSVKQQIMVRATEVSQIQVLNKKIMVRATGV